MNKNSVSVANERDYFFKPIHVCCTGCRTLIPDDWTECEICYCRLFNRGAE